MEDQGEEHWKRDEAMAEQGTSLEAVTGALT